MRNAEKSRTRKKYESATNSIAKRGQGENFPLQGQGGTSSLLVCPLWGLGQRLNCSAGDQHLKGTQQRCRQRSVPASNFARPQTRPQATLSTTCILSRQMGATDQHGRRFSLDAGLFHCRRKTESVSCRNRKPPAAIGQIVRICCRGCAMLLENALTPARTANYTVPRRSRLFAAVLRACRIR